MATTAGDTCLVDPTGIVTDATGNVYVNRRFRLYYGGIWGNTLPCQHKCGANIFVVKYSSSGAVLWQKAREGTVMTKHMYHN